MVDARKHIFYHYRNLFSHVNEYRECPVVASFFFFFFSRGEGAAALVLSRMQILGELGLGFSRYGRHGFLPLVKKLDPVCLSPSKVRGDKGDVVCVQWTAEECFGMFFFSNKIGFAVLWKKCIKISISMRGL